MKATFFFKAIVLVINAFILENKINAQDYYFERIYDETLAQASYIIADKNTKEAIVIDPKRDIDTYLEIAKENGFTITKVTETHIHADFLSGSRELAQATGAELLLSDEGGKDWQYNFPHVGLKDGSSIKIGQQIEIKVMHTPGHTPESITFLVNNKNKKATPTRAITGDFIFVGDVGRPDLLEKAAGQKGSQEEGAKQLYASIQKFSLLDDAIEIWPGHGAGSFCGKSLSNIPQSTLKEEKTNSQAFQFANDEAGFIAYILDGQPAPPKYFAEMKIRNKEARPLLLEVPIYPTLTENQLIEAIQQKYQIIDTRSQENKKQGTVARSLQIVNSPNFATWVGASANYNQPIVIIADNSEKEDITRKLMRIGLDNIAGFVSDVKQIGSSQNAAKIVDIKEFKKLLKDKNTQIIDVRTEKEYNNGHIKGVENIVLTEIENNLVKFDTSKTIIIHCQSGARAAIAHSVLEKNGIQNVKIYSGGINEWKQQGNELVTPVQN